MTASSATQQLAARAPPARAVIGAAGRETTLAVSAMAVIAVHVLDDNFLQPEPGTSAGDHLVSGLIPIAVLVAAAAVYGRLRAGGRAVLALVLGVFGVTVGVEGVYYARATGPSGDDFTSLLALPAGLILLGLGTVGLWRSRRLDDSRRRRYLRRSLFVVAGFLVAYGVLFPLVLAYVVTHTARAEVPTPEFGAPYEDVAFTTSDGLRLEGWYVPSQNGAAVIAFPGRSGPQKQTRMLVRHGYGVLLFDRRGEGASEGDPNVFGWDGERDLHAAVSFLRGRADVDPDRIGGIGLSVGGELMLQAAAESRRLRAVASEGAGGRSIREDIEGASGAETWISAPGYAMLTAGTALFSNGLPPPSLIDLVPRIAPRPVLLMYGGAGQPAEDDLNAKYYAAAGPPKALWEIPDAGHVAGITAQPEQYERRVVAFFDHALLGTSR
jgi:uncharacterized protein